MTPLVVAVVFVVALTSTHRTPGDPDVRAGFSVRYDGHVSSLRVTSVFVLPGHRLRVSVEDTRAGFALRGAGRLEREGAAAWIWHAPMAAGLYPLTIVAPDARDSIRLNAFVLVPANRATGGRLNGYEIGRYPTAGSQGRAPRTAPAGFVEVTRANRRTLVTPRFRLEQFLCKQEGGFPKYLALDPELLLTLEVLLEEVNAAGYAARTLHVMSGYRTPAYNRAIGNVPNSRHLWGEAADVFVDADGDGAMDDLNRDGRRDVRDADVLIQLANRALGGGALEFAGGLGRYGVTRAHGPFVHIDVRGYRARW